jgi:hypothetical protein
MIERILVPGIMEPVSHYCHVVQAGPHVWVSGVVGMDGNGDVPQGVVAQFDLAIDVMDQCLKAAGAGPPRPAVLDKWPEKPTFCGFPTADQERKKNVPTGETLSSNPLL